MFPIEDFAVGNPTQLYLAEEDYKDQHDLRPNESRKYKYVKR
jgi:hypothetical protein